MIPTMIVFGLLMGRWWRTALAAAAVLWPLLLLINGVFDHPPGPFAVLLAQASVLAVVNTGVGVAIHQVLLHLVRKLRTRWDRTPDTTKPPGP